MHILKNVINFSQRIGIERPKIAVLSATEEVLDSVQVLKRLMKLQILQKKKFKCRCIWAFGFDNSISKKSATIKGIGDVAGIADVLLVPSVETGNALVKM